MGSCEGKDKNMRRGSAAAVAAAGGEAGRQAGKRVGGGGTEELRASAY